MNTRLPLLLAVLLAGAASAQDATTHVERGRALVAAGHVSGSVDSLLAARATLALAAEAADPETAAWAAYYAALADHRLSYLFWGSDEARALGHAEEGAAALAPIVEDRALPAALRAEAAALRGTLLGSQVGLDPARAASLGAESQGAGATALRLAPDNPRVLLQSAAALLSTPPEWGGDRAEAVRQLERAVGLFGPSEGPAPAWGEDEAWAWLGMAHLMAEDAEAARPAIRRAEALNPGSPFVQYKLKPWLAQVEAQ